MPLAFSPPLFSLGSDDCGIDAACKLSRATNFTLTTIDCACLIRGGFWQLSQSGLEPRSFTLTPWLFASRQAHIAKLYGVKNPVNNEETMRTGYLFPAGTLTHTSPLLKASRATQVRVQWKCQLFSFCEKKQNKTVMVSMMYGEVDLKNSSVQSWDKPDHFSSKPCF